jgi:hypothetical protein
LNDQREFGGEFSYAKQFRKISYRSQYVYRNTTTYQNQWEEQDYFPTDQFDSRRYEQTSSKKNMVYKYATLQVFGFRIKEVNFQLSGLWTYDVDKNWGNNWMLSKLDNEIINCADLQDYNRNYTSKGGTLFVVSTNPKKKNTFVLYSGLDFTQGGRKGWQRDMLETSNRQVYLKRDWDNNDVGWNSNFKFSSVISPLFKLIVTGNCRYRENSSQGLGENLLDSKRSNSIDRTEQYDYRRGWSQTGRYVTLILSKRF